MSQRSRAAAHEIRKLVRLWRDERLPETLARRWEAVVSCSDRTCRCSVVKVGRAAKAVRQWLASEADDSFVETPSPLDAWRAAVRNLEGGRHAALAEDIRDMLHEEILEQERQREWAKKLRAAVESRADQIRELE